MKFALPLALCLVFTMSACDTIENRRSFYAPKKADGPYTRGLEDGTWDEQKTVDVQYAEARRQRTQPKFKEAPAPAPAPQNEAL